MPGRIDWEQCRALARVALLSELRTAGRPLGIGGSEEGRYGPLLLLFGVNAVFGVMLSLFIWWGGQPFLAATLHLTFLVFSVGSALVLEFHGVVLSPSDHELLAYQPVTSSTFFAARVLSIGAYVGALTVSLSFAPWLAYATAGGPHPVRAAAGVAATLLAAATTTLAAVVVYTSVLTVAPARYVRAALTLLQLTVALVVYGTLILVPVLVLRDSLAVGDTTWIFLSPGAWFASLIELSQGSRDERHVLAGALSVAGFGALVWAARGRLSLDFAERLGHLGARGEGEGPSSGARRAFPWFRAGEARAVRLLVAAQFRYDMRFRLTVLAIVPLTLIYLLLGLVDRADGRREDPFLVYMAALFFPATLKHAVTRTDAFRAAWVFYASPADLPSLLIALKNVVVVYFLVPYLLFAGVLLATTAAHPLQVPMLIVLLGLLSHTVLMFDLIADPELPFSRPPTAGRQTASMFLVMTVSVVLALVAPRLFAAGPAWLGALMMAALLWGNVRLHRTVRARIERQLASAEFDA
jgi:ABC-2 type transport system permease protein